VLHPPEFGISVQTTDEGTVMAAKPLVAYYRVSTQKQGASGLGLEDQVAAVDDHARDHDADVMARESFYIRRRTRGRLGIPFETRGRSGT
jgi:hypothetical protein